MGILYTFYSYKGGVGRSMALANVAALLSKQGHSVLCIDWDLEAPGLEKYFMKEPSVINGSRSDKPGVVDLATAFAREGRLDWKECLLEVYPYGRDAPAIHILSAGQDTPDYVPNLQALDWRRLFEQGFGAYLESLRDEWILTYDFVLVDSRTGITDIGGVCTIHLPDVLVAFFTANEQSLAGVVDVVKRARAKYDQLPEEYERPEQLLCVPVPSRFEYLTEKESATRWLQKFADTLGEIYRDWLPPEVAPETVLQQLYVPNIPFWSFGEGLPVVQEGTSDPRSLGYSYKLLARLLKLRLQWNAALQEDEQISADSPPDVVNQEAERAYKSLGDGMAEPARRIMSNLVLIPTSGKGNEVRRRAAMSDFGDLARNAIKSMADAHLLKVAHDEAAGEESVEIANDAILRHWDRLRKWIESDREFLIWRQSLNTSLAEWQKGNRNSSYLLRGGALELAKKFYESHMRELSADERGYIIGSISEEAGLQRRKRRYVALAGLIITLSIAIAGLLIYRSYKAQQDAKAKELAFNRAVQSTGKGIALFSESKTTEAIAQYNEALRNKDDYAAAYLNRGEAYLNIANSTADQAESDKFRAQAVNDFQLADKYGDENMKATARQFALDAQTKLSPITDLTPTTPTPQPTPTPTASPGATPRPSPRPTPMPTPTLTPTPVLSLTPRIYMQYGGDEGTKGKALAAYKKLGSVGYTLMGLANMDSVPQDTEVRYYRKSDSKDADEIVSLLRSMGLTEANAKYLVGFENSPKIRPRHFEVWIGSRWAK
ncbi:MAG TPA: tetratricopeptide repeat protein [Pyrinomonadaceae bacterium]|jgi:hypothetical protein|nr:tetratricopeptide repeat protein [Pyrinomonadaceae bacterium]